MGKTNNELLQVGANEVIRADEVSTGHLYRLVNLASCIVLEKQKFSISMVRQFKGC